MMKTSEGLVSAVGRFLEDTYHLRVLVVEVVQPLDEVGGGVVKNGMHLGKASLGVELLEPAAGDRCQVGNDNS